MNPRPRRSYRTRAARMALRLARARRLARERIISRHATRDARTSLAGRANVVAAHSRRGGAPILNEASPRKDVCAWLQWCDANGCHLDHLARLEGCDPYTRFDAWGALEEMLADD